MLGGHDGGMAQHTLDFGHWYAVGKVIAGESVAAGVGFGFFKPCHGMDVAFAHIGERVPAYLMPFVPCTSYAKEQIVIGKAGRPEAVGAVGRSRAA